jgi:hypothetical protein
MNVPPGQPKAIQHLREMKIENFPFAGETLFKKQRPNVPCKIFHLG